jgi:hypothetical protein
LPARARCQKSYDFCHARTQGGMARKRWKTPIRYRWDGAVAAIRVLSSRPCSCEILAAGAQSLVEKGRRSSETRSPLKPPSKVSARSCPQPEVLVPCHKGPRIVDILPFAAAAETWVLDRGRCRLQIRRWSKRRTLLTDEASGDFSPGTRRRTVETGL